MASRRSGRGAFRRRSATRVLVISGFILLTVWGLRYAARSGQAVSHRRGKRSEPAVGQVLDPWFIAKTCPQALCSCSRQSWASICFCGGNPFAPRAIDFGDAQRAGDGREKPAFAVVDLDCPGVGDRRRGTWPFWNRIEPCYFAQDDNFADRAAASCPRLPVDLPAESSPTSIRAN